MKTALLATALATGVVASSDGQTPSGWRAHDLTRPRPPVVAPGQAATPVPPPSDAVVLFDGSGVGAWRSRNGGPAGWVVRDGAMEAVPGAGYVYTRRGFGDVQLHVEWAAPTPPKGEGQDRGNSGVFLMNTYEVQVLDSYENQTYADGQAGALYGRSKPLVNACRKPGEWQTYDVLFTAPRFNKDSMLVAPARITVLHNGVVVQLNTEIKGTTEYIGLPKNMAHGKGPLKLQDHGDLVSYRNIWVREL